MAGYGDDAGFSAWVASNGYTVPGGSPAVAVLRQRGSAYVDGLYGTQDTKRLRFPGYPTGGVSQERAWPRSAVFIFNALIDSTVIPTSVVEASYFAGLQEATSPGILSASAAEASQIKREKVGLLETEYFASGDTAASAAMTTFSFIEGLLVPLLLPPLPTTFLLRSVGC